MSARFVSRPPRRRSLFVVGALAALIAGGVWWVRHVPRLRALPDGTTLVLLGERGLGVMTNIGAIRAIPLERGIQALDRPESLRGGRIVLTPSGMKGKPADPLWLLHVGDATRSVCAGAFYRHRVELSPSGKRLALIEPPPRDDLAPVPSLKVSDCAGDVEEVYTSACVGYTARSSAGPTARICGPVQDVHWAGEDRLIFLRRLGEFPRETHGVLGADTLSIATRSAAGKWTMEDVAETGRIVAVSRWGRLLVSRSQPVPQPEQLAVSTPLESAVSLRFVPLQTARYLDSWPTFSAGFLSRDEVYLMVADDPSPPFKKMRDATFAVFDATTGALRRERRVPEPRMVTPVCVGADCGMLIYPAGIPGELVALDVSSGHASILYVDPDYYAPLAAESSPPR